MPSGSTVLARRFSAILTSGPCRRIDYWLGGFHVTGGGLATVARALEIGGVNDEGITITVEPTAANVAASYYAMEDKLFVASENWAATDRFEKICVVHESIHALRDMQGANVTWNNKPYRPNAMTDDSTAYFGGCLFDIYWQQDVLGAVSENPPWLADRKAAIHAVAYKVALAYTKRTAGSPLTTEDLQTMNTSFRDSSRKAGSHVPRFQTWDGVAMPMQ